eukprot:m.1927 g.1927  ORF g.1927 m.1927 type:complete len:93 (-) comp1900_c0_seq1:97-375(-)
MAEKDTRGEGNSQQTSLRAFEQDVVAVRSHSLSVQKLQKEVKTLVICIVKERQKKNIAVYSTLTNKNIHSVSHGEKCQVVVGNDKEEASEVV